MVPKIFTLELCNYLCSYYSNVKIHIKYSQEEVDRSITIRTDPDFQLLMQFTEE